jgi:hypothetical protein
VQKARCSDVTQLPPFLRPAPATQQGQQAPLPGGSKCSLETLRGLLALQGVAWEPLWARVQEVVLVALFAAQDAIPHCVNSFELFGFDVMVDRCEGTGRLGEGCCEVLCM